MNYYNDNADEDDDDAGDNQQRQLQLLSQTMSSHQAHKMSITHKLNLDNILINKPNLINQLNLSGDI